MSHWLDDWLVDVVAQNPGRSARELARLLNREHGDSFTRNIVRSDVNAALYCRRSTPVFRSYEKSPPRWYLANMAQAAGWGVDADERLYSWQKQAIANWGAAGRQGIVVAVTGTGKSSVASHILRRHIDLGVRSLVLVPSVILQQQWMRVIRDDIGIEATSLLGGQSGMQFDPNCPVTISTVQSMYSRADEFDGMFDLLVADECHRYGSPEYQRALLPSVPARLGLTATLEREDGAEEDVLLPYFGDVCFEYDFAAANRDRVIAPFTVVFFAVSLAPQERHEYDEAGRKMRRYRSMLINDYGVPAEPHGQFLRAVNRLVKGGESGAKVANLYLNCMKSRARILSESEEKLDAIEMLRPAIEESTKTVIFTESTKGADRWAAALDTDDLTVAALHSGIAADVRQDMLNDLRFGELQCAVAVHILDEGVDVPEIDLGIMVAGTQSRRQFVQRVGRVLRRKPDGRGAVFVLLYARETSEDPHCNASGDGLQRELVSELVENAVRRVDVSSADVNANWLGGLVSECLSSARS